MLSFLILVGEFFFFYFRVSFILTNIFIFYLGSIGFINEGYDTMMTTTPTPSPTTTMSDGPNSDTRVSSFDTMTWHD
jgi:hypothetical protein